MGDWVSAFESTCDCSKVHVPSKIPEMLAERGVLNMYLTRGMNLCLFLFSENQWEKSKTDFMETFGDKKGLVKLFFASESACRVSIVDDFIVVPKIFIAYAELKEKVIWVVRPKRVEIWNKERWDGYSG